MSKDQLRREVRARLRSLTPAKRAHAGAEIARRVWLVSEVAAAKKLLLFASLPEEVPTDSVAEEARRRGIEVIYPRCLPATRELALHRTTGPEELRPGQFGIREPDADACPLVRIEEIDAALLPGLAFDRRGRRLGRGAGYYDRLLADARWRALRCGLFFAVQEVAEVPTDTWDVPLDAVVTENEIVR
ncbi:MAG TPA: 5-formyltetrahydrofolate cyclo-ligase [Longimicrobiaceae bacterium]|nr:5-formyltetrahydrofolate cyclo-ligase [Longimicrobiaceae bacterium]